MTHQYRSLDSLIGETIGQVESSPDGRYLQLLSEPRGRGESLVLAQLDTATGRLYDPDGNYFTEVGF